MSDPIIRQLEEAASQLEAQAAALRKEAESRRGDLRALFELPLPSRAAAALREMGAETIDDVQRINDRYFLRIPNFGRKTLCQLRAMTGPLKDVEHSMIYDEHSKSCRIDRSPPR